MGNLAPVRPCIHCGRDFKPTKGNHRNLCSVLCRFMEKIVFSESGCWDWSGSRNSDGYGTFMTTDGSMKAHRWAYANIAENPLVSGMTLDHLCRNRSCVNPTHLEQVTHAENMHRSAGHSLLTHCVKKGHEFTDENTGWHAGKRYCRQCKRDREAITAPIYRAQRKAKTNA